MLGQLMGRNVRPMEFPFWKGITVGQSRVPGYPLTATRNPIPLSFSFPIKENQNCSASLRVHPLQDV